MICGYEAMGRIGSVVGNVLIQRGFHPTAQAGVFGATAAAGLVLGLDLTKLTRAFGLASSMSSGSMKFTQDAEGTMIKRMHAGMPSERGVLAAKLAASGFTGPRAAIEGPYGFATIFTGIDNLTRMVDGLGRSFEIDSISIKLYPCCRMFHSLIEAIAECRAMPGFQADQIVSVEAYGPRNMLDGHLEFRPASTMAAQYSLPYTIAAATMLDPARRSRGCRQGQAKFLGGTRGAFSKACSGACRVRNERWPQAWKHRARLEKHASKADWPRRDRRQVPVDDKCHPERWASGCADRERANAGLRARRGGSRRAPAGRCEHESAACSWEGLTLQC
jgi:hypothetical protein